MKITFDYIFSFGKHRDESVKDIFDTDPTYLEWCLQNIHWFEMDQIDIDKIAIAAQKERDAWKDDHEDLAVPDFVIGF